MKHENPYNILGVKKTDSIASIKKKYRKLAMKYHPDRNLGNLEKAERFKEICNAYRQILEEGNYYSDIKDSFIKKGEKIGAFFYENFNKKNIINQFRDYYEKNITNNVGDDIEVNISLSPKDIFENTEKAIHLDISVPCEACCFEECERCNGTKSIKKTIHFVFHSQDKKLFFKEQADYIYGFKRGNVIINIIPKEDRFRIINEKDVVCELKVNETINYFDNTTYCFDAMGKHVIKNKGIEGGNLIFYVFN